MAREYRSRPSALLGIASNSFRAFSVDRAVWMFGTAVEADMEAAEKNLGNKSSDSMKAHARQRVWDAYMGIDTSRAPGRFREPVKKRRG